MRYCLIVAGVLISVLGCAATRKLNKSVPRIASSLPGSKLLLIPLAIVLAGLAVLLYSVWYQLPYAIAPLCEEAVGVCLMGAGNLLGLLLTLVLMAVVYRKHRANETAYGRTAMLLYGVSAAVASVMVCIDYFIV